MCMCMCVCEVWWSRGDQAEPLLYLWCTFVNALHLSVWNKRRTYTLWRVSRLKTRASEGEREIRERVISTFIFFTISFFRHIWSQCKLEIRREPWGEMEFIRSGSIGLQWVAREATDNLLGYLRSLFTRSLSFSLPHFSLPLLHPHSHLLTFISLSLSVPQLLRRVSPYQLLAFSL